MPFTSLPVALIAPIKLKTRVTKLLQHYMQEDLFLNKHFQLTGLLDTCTRVLNSWDPVWPGGEALSW